ncbi:MAG: hypothetical protein O2798_09240 [Chloroflexi bacterium]|nr:hypothetical protein [Chloroflexota bacterium]MDA1241010.1 hypothetical protein [Chloroflexota bacterium]
MTAGPSASAEGPAAIVVGFVVPGADGHVATRVRAIGDGGAVCGTAEVMASGANIGFYAIRVASGTEKAGCPLEGAVIGFSLLSSNIDDGVPAHANGDARFRGGQTVLVHLAPSAGLATPGSWSGPTPTPDLMTTLIWEGPDAVPSEQAIQTIPVEVHGLWHLLPGGGRYVSYTPGAPLFAQSYPLVHTGDIVFVRAR